MIAMNEAAAKDGALERRIDVLLVEADAAARGFLSGVLESDPRIRVVGAVGDGRAALDFLQQTRPDVVLMDNRMPGMDGFETTRHIMESRPLPIVLCTAANEEGDTVFRSLEAGAVACVERPEHGAAQAAISHLLQTVKLMSEVKVVRRWARTPAAARPVAAAGGWYAACSTGKLVGVGASTGGPLVLQTLLAALPGDFSLPVLVVQHIARGFLSSMAEWLRQTSGLRIHIGAHGMLPEPGHVYLAPDDFQMSVGSHGQILLSKETPASGLRPSVACLFHSLAEVCGPHAVGVLLTGMGKDGAAELKLMKDRGAVTIAQDKETSIVHGMPGAAIALGGATHVLPAEKIAGALIALANPYPRVQRN